MTAADCRWIAVACLSWALVAATYLSGQTAAPPAGAGYLLRSLLKPGDRHEARADLLDEPVLPGSVMKVVTLASALEHGVINPATTHLCRRTVTVDGVSFVCAHPDLRRPLNAAEALAYSCNDFFVSLAPRLTRDMFNRTRLAAGLPPIGAGTPFASSLVGLAGPRVTPRALLDLVARAAGFDPDRPMRLSARTREVLLRGLRGAATYGSASALGEAGVSALAKTGTAPMPGGGAMGVVVALTPADRPDRGIIVVAPGAAGLDAAGIAASLLSGRTETALPESARTQMPRAPQAGAAAPPSGRQTARPAPALPATLRLGVTGRNGRTTTDTVPLEDYVARVVAGEGEPRGADAAQQALAIAVRTFALANRNRHRREGFDLCDTTHCQVLRPATTATRNAALRTAGRVLLSQGQPAFVFYSAWCGGHVEHAPNVWPGAVDYLKGEITDDACVEAPAWTSDIRVSDLERALRAAGLRGDRLRDLRIESRNGSGRAATLRAVGFSPAIVAAHDFRMAVGRVLGWQRLKSTAFDLDRTGAGYRFRGRGFGHGVGLCVVGAGFRAAAGASADAILRFYFPRLELSGAATLLTEAERSTPAPPGPPSGRRGSPSSTAGGAADASGAADPAPNAATTAAGIQLALPAEEERDRSDVMRAIVAARQDIVARTGMPAPPLIRITVHPTVESFGRTTGQPWWVSAATLGAAIEVLPTTMLRRQGVLERTLRHELAHVVVDERLAGRPMWVREGAALFLSAPPSPATAAADARVSCPSDQELLRPASAGTQRDAYARAESCFRRAVAGGKAWYDVR